MFGRSLEETLQVEARLGGSYIPVFVHRCALFIREHGKIHKVCFIQKEVGREEEGGRGGISDEVWVCILHFMSMCLNRVVRACNEGMRFG